MDQAITAPIFKNRTTTLQRIEKYISPSTFTDVNLYGKLYKNPITVENIEHWQLPGSRGAWIPWKFDEIIKETFETVKVGFVFGPVWSTHWFKVSFHVPTEWAGQEVRIRWDTDSESMVWSTDGEPLQGLSTGTSHQMRSDFVISESWNGENDSLQTYYIETVCSTMFGNGKGGMINPPDPQKTYTLSRCEIVCFDTKVHSLVIDLQVLAMFARELKDDQRGYNAMFAGNQMINLIVDNKWEEAGKISKKFFANRNGDMSHEVAMIGNCHIDTAWLWPYSETIRKGGRSWSATARLTEKFPDMVFACSQAQQLQWVKEMYPSLFKKLQKLHKSNNFIPVGSLWVEMDGNLPSGESFIRQFLYGQKFFKEEFGVYCKEFWLPDTFGYNAQIPQICNHFGIKRFLTQKLSWNLVNKFPNNTFIWEGLDGSKVLTHFPPGDSYEMDVKVKEVLKTQNNLKDKGRVNLSAFLYGYGDGGGGPTEDMLMRAERLENVDGCPRMTHMTPDQLFTRLEKEVRNLSTWVGELYLELHNGTYTAQAHTKKQNRKCEFALRDAEILMSMVSMGKMSAVKDIKELREKCEIAWKKVLLNQFHDVIPGTSIGIVFEDSDKLYEEVLDTTESVINDCLQFMSNTTENGKDVLIFNSFPWDIKRVLKLGTNRPTVAINNSNHLEGSSFVEKLVSDPYFGQIADNVDMYVPVEIPALSFAKPKLLTVETVNVTSKDGVTILENKFFSAHFSSSGQILKLIKKGEKSRDIFDSSLSKESEKHCGNIITLYDDIPLYWDAWDVMDYHLETRKVLNNGDNNLVTMPVQVNEAEPHFAEIEWHLKISETSVLKQKVSITSLDPYLTFDCNVDWNESHKFMKVEFDTNLLCRAAKYDVQFGHIERATHRNTSWDSAKFEVCGHKWASLEEGCSGIAILNDCKYGWSAYGSKLSLSLLRAPKAPDPNCDIGSHHFKYGVMPYHGDLMEEGVIEASYEFNRMPLVKFNASSSLVSSPCIEVEGDGVMVEAMKVSESNAAATVIRLVELGGNRVEAKVKIPKKWKLSQAFVCNGMEEPLQEISVTQEGDFDIITLTFTPFQIYSLKLIY